jgi:Flp pilus assembly protein TadG
VNLKTKVPNRRGAVAPMVAILLIPLLGMVAFAVDIGYMVQVRIELTNVADAAALAGVQQLYAPYENWLRASTLKSQSAISQNAIALAKATAQSIAANNHAGNLSIQLVDADVDVGYTSALGVYSAGNAIPAGVFPNTVKVTARRDNTNLPNSNGELALFFAPVLGHKSAPLTASASAIASEGVITSFKTGLGNSSILPVAVNQTEWTDFFYNGVNSPFADPNAPSGAAWFQIYPGGQGESMDGLLSLYSSKAASQQNYSGSTGWIQAGPTSSDISSLLSGQDLPLNGAQSPWASGPGLKSSLLSDFQAIISTQNVHLLPLYDPISPGTVGGGNGTYEIVHFVPIHLVYATGNGQTNMDIAVTSAGVPITDPTAYISGITPLGTSSTPPQYRVLVAARLSQ